MGEPVEETVSHFLRRGGINDYTPISLIQLREILLDLMGEQATDILMEHIILELDMLGAES